MKNKGGRLLERFGREYGVYKISGQLNDSSGQTYFDKIQGNNC